MPRDPDHACSRCGMILDDFKAVTPGILPTEGAVSVCLYCAHIAIFTGNGLETRPVTHEEMDLIVDHPDLLKAFQLVNLLNNLKPEGGK